MLPHEKVNHMNIDVDPRYRVPLEHKHVSAASTFCLLQRSALRTRPKFRTAA